MRKIKSVAILSAAAFIVLAAPASRAGTVNYYVTGTFDASAPTTDPTLIGPNEGFSIAFSLPSSPSPLVSNLSQTDLLVTVTYTLGLSAPTTYADTTYADTFVLWTLPTSGGFNIILYDALAGPSRNYLTLDFTTGPQMFTGPTSAPVLMSENFCASQPVYTFYPAVGGSSSGQLNPGCVSPSAAPEPPSLSLGSGVAFLILLRRMIPLALRKRRRFADEDFAPSLAVSQGATK